MPLCVEVSRRAARGLACGLAFVAAVVAAPARADVDPCRHPVYLTIDTGHMGVAPLVAEVLQRQEVRASFFLANERTRSGGSSLDAEWAPWWQARAKEGHVFGSHTWNHDVFRKDARDGFVVRATAGVDEGEIRTISAEAYCRELQRPAERFEVMTGRKMLPLFRAPGGKTSPALLKAAKACGWTHVPWSPRGFLGDELSSETHPNEMLLRKALREVREGDILLMHLGIWSRKDPWAPAVLEPLIRGLKAKGLCFATLDEHPAYRDLVRSPVAASQP